MALDDIIKKISSDAQFQADEIIQYANKQVASIEKDNDQKILEYKNKFLLDAKQKAINHAKSILITNTNNQKNLLLKQKRKLLDDIFLASYRKLLILDDKSYQAVIEKLLMHISKLKLDNLHIICQGKYLSITKKAIDELSIICHLSADEKFSDGGFIAISDKTKLDFSFTNVLDQMKSDIEKNLSQTLFASL